MTIRSKVFFNLCTKILFALDQFVFHILIKKKCLKFNAPKFSRDGCKMVLSDPIFNGTKNHSAFTPRIALTDTLQGLNYHTHLVFKFKDLQSLFRILFSREVKL